MSKWSGQGQPNTRRKLHRWRMDQQRERQEDLAAQRDLMKELDDSARRSGVDSMLTEG